MRLVHSSFVKSSFFIIALTLLFASVGRTQSTVPSISSFSPISGPIGASVTINGTNFNATPSNNIVYFGAVRAEVTSASSTSLVVKVPSGATYQPLTVTDITTGLTAYSNAPFVVTYAGGSSFNESTYSVKTDIAVGIYPYSTCVGDLNGDGKPDLIVISSNNTTIISVFLNTTTPGASTPSFSAKTDFEFGGMGSLIYGSLGDLNGDGRLDMVVVNQSGGTVAIFLNTTAPGASVPSFSPKVDLITGDAPSSVSICDLNNDGKPDLAVANTNSISVSVFLNTTIAGASTPTFSDRTDYSTGYGSFIVSAGDLNGDSKPDLAIVKGEQNTVAIFINNTIPGSMIPSFSEMYNFTTSNYQIGFSLGDLNSDNKLDLVTTSLLDGTIAILLNTTSQGDLIPSFSEKIEFSTGNWPFIPSVYDLNGDGKLDLAVPNAYSNNVSILLNATSPGASTPSLPEKIDFAAGNFPFYVSISDFNSDGKPDMAVTNNNDNTVSVFLNTIPTVNHTPIANAGPDQTAYVGAQVTLNGSASSDADGDALTYTWEEGITVLGSGVTLAVALPVGSHTITLTVSDGIATSSDDVVITVLPPLPPPNSPPVANAGRDTTVEQTKFAGAQVTLDGSASSDPDGDALTYVWKEDTTTIGTEMKPTVTLSVGIHTIVLSVADGSGAVSSDSVVITVVAPKITVDHKPLILWPPNHHFETVKASEIIKSVVDHKGKKISIQNVRIYSVSSDESDDAPCNGNKHINKNDDRKHDSDYKDKRDKNHGDSDDDDECDDRGDRRSKNDIIISNDAKKVNLRAEREGGGNGRVYTITLVVKDAGGSTGYASYEVWVPMHKKSAAVNDGPAYTVYAKPNTIFAKESAESSYAELASTAPEEFKLYNNFPNPFNPSTEIRFAIQENDFVSLKVYDLLGHEIATLINNQLAPGTYTVRFDATRLSSGTYIYRLNTSTSVQTKRMILMK